MSELLDRMATLVGLVLAALLAALTLSTMIMQVKGRELGRQWAQSQVPPLAPQTRDWLKEQRVPNGAYRCCDEADGIFAEEDHRPDEDGSIHYWARFEWHDSIYDSSDQTWNTGPAIDSGWIRVPDDAIVPNKSIEGNPVVWWKKGYADPNQVGVRCFAPGSGA